ncbi:MAG TPA: hypothetical protein VHO70_12675 [Chitinispirillaceae bacterium]|nr:hypothetical protein [Chitinispirillaceae bacterium]
MILNLEQKKGNPFHLDGKVTVYAQIDIDPSDLMSLKHPISSMVHNGLLVAQGNFKEQSNLKDFLKSEMGISTDESMEEGLSQLLEKMNGIESALDPQKLKERLENMGELEEFIPTPAKIVPFHSEQEILDQEGDVFFTGIFKNVGNAVLSVNALPILYQARFREQEHQKVRNEIENLINQIEQADVPSGSQTIKTPGVNAEERLLKEFIPNMLYWRKESHSFTSAEQQFRSFMKGYQFQEDVEAIIKIIGSKNELGKDEYKLLELYAKKIASIKEEDFSAAENYSKEIQRLQMG